MNARERVLACLRGEQVDRVPILLQGFQHTAPEKVQDVRKREIVQRLGDQIHLFLHCPSFVNRYLVTPRKRMTVVTQEQKRDEVIKTTEIDTPKGILTAVVSRNATTRTNWTLKYPVETLEDIEKIRSIPWEPAPDLTPLDLSEPPEFFETRYVTRTSISSPFVCVAGMMTYEYFLQLCATHFELIRELTEVCLERILKTLDIILEKRNIEYVWMGGCEWLTPPMGSPELYGELVQKFERRVIEKIHEAGALSHVHCHGNVRSTLELVIERGGDFFEPVEPPPDGDITFAEAKKLAAGRMALGGNIEARILENEDEEVVEKACRQAFEGGKERMLFETTAGPLAKMTPKSLRNYHRMIDVWEELSAN